MIGVVCAFCGAAKPLDKDGVCQDCYICLTGISEGVDAR
jgi:NMD protein affecting ribosome stability and mRNA decay